MARHGCTNEIVIFADVELISLCDIFAPRPSSIAIRFLLLRRNHKSYDYEIRHGHLLYLYVVQQGNQVFIKGNMCRCDV